MELKIKDIADYQAKTKLAESNPNKFWANIAENFHWFKKWSKVSNCNMQNADNKWFIDGKTNISYNCLDRHLEDKAKENAIIWEANDPSEKNRYITYEELASETKKFANLLSANQINKGDRVCIYMPMIPEAIIAMLACARIGAIHSVIFAGFSANALEERINDCGAKLIITADLLKRGNKNLNLLDIVNKAVENTKAVKNIILYKRSDNLAKSTKNIIIWQDELSKFTEDNNAEHMDSEDPLFILYTSGSTGKPKGILHSIGGYMVYAAYSFQNVFQYKEKEIFFCTADIGWITGHTYMTYGPLLCGATILMFEGVPTHPNPSRFWQIIEKHNVNIFYTAPTAIRALMHQGLKHVENYKMPSLRVLGSVGEPINQEAWQWYYDNVGKGNSPIIDSWWQTETGGILISPLANITENPATYATKPLPGIEVALLNNKGDEITSTDKNGNLCIKKPWPSMLRTIWGDHERCKETYFNRFPGYYFAGDGAYKSKSGNFRITGRVDDVINVSGHRIGTAEVEDVINLHNLVSESAVIGYPHAIKGEAIQAFVIISETANNLTEEIINLIKDHIGSFAKPDKITIVSDLPKTRSGKIMRRILKKIVSNSSDYGDISTLVNPNIIKELEEAL
ncbi:MAG: acetate--CoA ligase [Alphaproteobacteria bacterium]|nr:acetate--CoA ligase [Alphaproteobacteria bacterium]